MRTTRRKFLAQTGTFVAGTALASTTAALGAAPLLTAKKRLAIVGTGHRGLGLWATTAVEKYGNTHEFVGLCDINPGRVAYAKTQLKLSCPVFTDFEKMMRDTRPDILIVTTVDATHDQFIIKGMEMGADIITEKPMTIDEFRCRAILEAERRTGRKITVTFNYRYSPHRQKIWELLRAGTIGDIISADFHWYLDVYHGADYFRRWHRLREKSGSLLVHKATHHFDLLNWWLDSDPEEVFAFGSLDFYGKNHAFRHTNCRGCPHSDTCDFYWDMTQNQRLMDLYAANEHHDGYLRDGCVWREDVNIFDKMAVQMRYAGGIQVSYSLTTYSPYEGYRISFNGTKGKIDAWIRERQATDLPEHDEIVVSKNFGDIEYLHIPQAEGHGGGDARMTDYIFRTPGGPDPYRQSAGSRDGAMSVLIGVAARNSIDTGKPVRIADLTDIAPKARRP